MGVNVREKAGWIEVKINNRFEDWLSLCDFEEMSVMDRQDSLKKLGIKLHDSRIKVIDIVENIIEKQKKGNSGEEDEKQKLFVPGIEKNGVLHEIVFDGTDSFFISLEGGVPMLSEKLEFNGALYFPVKNQTMERGAIILPKGIQDYGSEEELFEELKSFIHRYCDVSEDFTIFCCYYIFLSWVYDRLNTVPYLRALGDFSTGKSRVLDVIEAHDSFGPKVIATRFRFYDQALESRCLTEHMVETDREDIPTNLPQAFFTEQENLRQKLLMFRLKERSNINSDNIQKIDLGELELRLKQALSGFAVLFASKPALLERFKQFVFRYQEELIEERANSFEGKILQAIHDLSEREIITSKDIGLELCEGEDKEKEAAKISRQIGRHLSALGIKTASKKIEGQTKRVVEWKEKLFQKLFRKYIPKHAAESCNQCNQRNQRNQPKQQKLQELQGLQEIQESASQKMMVE